jgi:hypothetical protein
MSAMKIDDIDGLERVLKDVKFQHLTDANLVSYRDEQLDETSRAQTEAHLSLCLVCERRLSLLRKERAAIDTYTPDDRDMALVKQVLQQVRASDAARPAPCAMALERLAEYLRQASEDWRTHIHQHSPMNDPPVVGEIWRWQSPDGQFSANARLESPANLKFCFSARSADLEGACFRVMAGALNQDATLKRISETEVGAEIVPQPQQPACLDQISFEIVR